MDFITFWAFLFVLGLSLAVPLGPVNLEMIKQSTIENNNHRMSFFRSFLTGFGAMNGDFIIAFSALTIGGSVLSAVVNDYAIKTILFGFNVIILSYLGISAFRQKITNTDELSLDITNNNYNSLFPKVSKRYITGLIIVVTSPWSYLWWASFGSYILFGDFDSFDLGSRLIIIVCFLSGVFFWVLSFSSLLTLSKKFASKSFLDLITKVSASILLIYAISFSFDTITYLRLWFAI